MFNLQRKIFKNFINNLVIHVYQPVGLRQVDIDDVETIFSLQSYHTIRQIAYSSLVPSRGDHF